MFTAKLYHVVVVVTRIVDTIWRGADTIFKILISFLYIVNRILTVIFT